MNYKLIFRVGSIPGHLLTIIRSLIGEWLFEPIQVFYLIDEKVVYPINSKSGNSSLKLMLINRYNRTFKSSFPEIHNINPVGLTNGNVQRFFFYRKADYREFCRGKHVLLVVRDPVARLRSGYLDVITERNRWYMYPSRLYNIFNIKPDISVKRMLRFVNCTPDNIADKHFRAQTFYLSGGILETASKVQVAELSYYLSSEHMGKSGVRHGYHLNKSSVDKASSTDLSLINREQIAARYAADIELFDQVKEVGIVTLK